jgi:fructose/tagatose bisphosphate aldolase
MNIDNLIYKAVFSGDDQEKRQARQTIRRLAEQTGIISSSIHPLYMAFGRGEVTGFTVPALNIRTLTYDTARIIFRLMLRYNIGALIFEIARSEMEYTNQRPDEYTTAILAAAIKERFTGPVFLQGDHFQLSKSKFSADPEQEIERIKQLSKEAIDAQFYNIDIDASTLVDLDQQDLRKQQLNNYTVTAKLTEYIRSLQPKNLIVSIGGEIGHIGGKNSTVDDFVAFMEGYLELLPKKDGISKVSVQTGSSHGGIPLPDGTIANVKLDFSVLRDIGAVAREKFHIGGPVQHGASTLPQELFGKFPEVGTLEIHLATGFQNIVYEHMPEKLRKEIYDWLKSDRQEEWEEGWSEEQFIYKTRKKALGPFKERLWNLSPEEKQPITEALEKQFTFLFEKLKVFNTKEVVKKYIY